MGNLQINLLTFPSKYALIITNKAMMRKSNGSRQATESRQSVGDGAVLSPKYIAELPL